MAQEDDYEALLELIDAAFYKAQHIGDEVAIYVLGVASLHVSQVIEAPAALKTPATHRCTSERVSRLTAL